MGSLGFLTPFDFSEHKARLAQLITAGCQLTLRSRLSCSIVRAAKPGAADGGGQPAPEGEWLALNEVVIDRGTATMLGMLHVYCDEHFITSAQADGIIVATPTGSTAYCSRRAGRSSRRRSPPSSSRRSARTRSRSARRSCPTR